MNNLRFVSKVPITFALTTCIFFVSISLCLADQYASSQWSFEDHPQPTFSGLSKAEHDRLDDGIYGLERVEYCRAVMANGFDLYVSRYPEFRTTAEIDQRYSAWKRYVASHNIFGLGSCPFSLPTLELIELDKDLEAAHLSFCGYALPPPVTDLEHRFADLIGELVENAMTGQTGALRALVLTHDMKTRVILNPDIEYALRRSLQKRGAMEPSDWAVDHLLPQLDAKRRAFLDQAVDRNDLGAVFDTTTGCAPK